MAIGTDIGIREISLSKTLVLRFALGVALSAFSGALLLMAYPPLNIWPLMWVGLVPYLYAQYRLMPLRHSGLAVAIADLAWLWPMLARVFAGGPWFIVHLGLFIAVISFFLNTERKHHHLTGMRWFVLYGVLSWVAFEAIRNFIPFMGTMGFVANTQASQAWLIQPVSIFSIYGLGCMIILVNFTLAQALIAVVDRRWLPEDAVTVDPVRNRRWLIGTGIALAVWIGLSLIILNTAPKDAPTIRVAALQPGFPEPAHVDPDTPQELRVRTLLEQGYEAADQGAQVLFTPELGMAVDPQVNYTQEFKNLAVETGTYAFWAYGLDVEEGFRNESVFITPDGEFQEVYGKIHPGIGERKSIYSDVYPVYDTPFGRLATVICMDANFTDVTRRLAEKGAQLIAIATRETKGISEQTWTHHVLRAVETRTAVVATDVAWWSPIIDPYGRILEMEKVPESTRLTVVRDVPLGSGKTLVNVLGDWVSWVALAGWVGFMVYFAIIERRAKKQTI